MDGSLIPVDVTGRDSFAPRFRRRKVILVTGGAGFVGSHLCERLIAEGHSVVCLDNLLTGRKQNVAGLLDHPQFRFLEQDILSRIDWQGPLDEIYNLACAASPPLYQRDPIHTFRTCTEGVLNLLALARATGARILQASTSEVYGDPEISPQHEGYRGCVNTVGPRACYDEGKRAAETLFWEFGAHQGLEVRIARIFNTYGPRMSPEDGRVVSNFIVQALTRSDITLYGDGMQTRSFCYVDDLVAGLMALMASEVSEPVNLGNPGEFTMRELAEMVLAQTGSPSRLVHRPLPVDDPRQRRPDISQAARLLGWAPTVPLAEGIARTIRHFAGEPQVARAREALLDHA
ncbi:UDP-glucuronic acid decarboxylase family protein [Cereibacter johrii]|uniref:UDP-glucuronate decarboxylase n=1 Tax=Cereibacter johrii TaxID=445629 RepID=A0ABX5JB37_9RHOB|nr:UDP-glucuronic acid decarboxylase family protein [Cereibacter johrii]ODM43628.1 NAD-dependent dehydratase [Cereibacter johrii]PTM80405.1 UDP-glucuronate decarboxylase [Cereibacter johrii]